MASESDISTVINNLLQRKKALQAQVRVLMERIAAANAEMNGVIQAIGRIDVTIKEIQMATPEAQEIMGSSDGAPPMSPVSTSSALRGTGLTVAGYGNSQALFEQIARDVMIQRGRPVNTTDLLAAFRERGSPIEGGNPWKIASNNLWKAKRDGRLIHRIGLGYWPADLPCAAINYVPPPEGIAPLTMKSPKEKIRPPRKPRSPRKGRLRAISPEQVELALRWWNAGKATNQIARDLGGVAVSTLYKYLDEAGAQPRDRKNARKPSNRREP